MYASIVQFLGTSKCGIRKAVKLITCIYLNYLSMAHFYMFTEAWLPNKTFSTHCAHILRRLMDKAMLSKALICLKCLGTGLATIG